MEYEADLVEAAIAAIAAGRDLAAKLNRDAPKQDRYAAYLDFQNAAVAGMVYFHTLATNLDISRGWDLRRRIARDGHARGFQRTAPDQLTNLAQRLRSVYLVGGSRVCDAAEGVVNALMPMAPLVDSGAKALEPHLATFNRATIVFTRETRVDLGYARGWREHWWQRNRDVAPVIPGALGPVQLDEAGNIVPRAAGQD